MAHYGSDIKKILRITYIWKIENMRACGCLCSPSFTEGGMEKTRWCLELSYNESSGLISLKIRRGMLGPDSLEVKFELSFLGTNGWHLKKLSRFTFRKGYCFPFSIREDIFVKERAEFLAKGALTIRCRMWRTGTEISKHSNLLFARTILREYRVSCVSELREFSSLEADQKRELLLNPTTEQDIQFTFIFFIREAGDKQYLCVEARSRKTLCNGKISICLLDAEGKVVRSKGLPVSGLYHLSFKDFFEKCKLVEDKASLLPEDVLSIRCEFDIVYAVLSRIENNELLESLIIKENASDAYQKNSGEPDEISPSAITEANKSFLEEDVLSDVGLQTGYKSFPAHKCILSDRSPVFRNMFNGDMNTSKCVKIPDVDEETLGELLSYIYTDTVGNLDWQGAADLYYAADKYKLLQLKRRCANLLKSDISLSSVCAILGIADLHQDKGLREAAEDFLMRHKEEVISSDTWQSFKGGNSKLAVETMERIDCNIGGYR